MAARSPSWRRGSTLSTRCSASASTARSSDSRTASASRRGRSSTSTSAIIDQTADLVAAYKPNLAFYEARGGDGWDELAETLDLLRAHEPEVVTIADAQARRHRQHERGVRGGDLRHARLRRRRRSSPGSGARPCGRSSSGRIARASCCAARATRARASSRTFGSTASRCGRSSPASSATNGTSTATACSSSGRRASAELRRARELCPSMPFLVPGVGAQGGTVGRGRRGRPRRLGARAAHQRVAERDLRGRSAARRPRAARRHRAGLETRRWRGRRR